MGNWISSVAHILLLIGKNVKGYEIIMHYLTLVTLEIPKLKNDYHTDILNFALLQELNEAHEKEPNNIMIDVYLQKFRGLKTTFARTVDALIEDKLEPYCESTENPDYLEFEDHTAELRQEYENQSVDCIRLPEGRIVSTYNHFVWDRFIIHDGKVFEKYAGPLKCDKRTKKAKKMTVIPNYPYKKLYKTFERFAEEEQCMDYNKEFDGYGYLYNPNAFWDWYQIGGRWPNLFLVKNAQRVSIAGLVKIPNLQHRKDISGCVLPEKKI